MNKEIENLIIVGNGFDAHCGLKSNFKDFFQQISSSLKDIENFWNEPIHYESELPVNKPRSTIVAQLIGGNESNSLLAEMDIQKLESRTRVPLFLKSRTEIESLMGNKIITRPEGGFWAAYFNLKNEIPNYWYDVEKILRDFFEKSVSDIGIQDSSTLKHDYKSTTMTQFEGIYESIAALEVILNGDIDSEEAQKKLTYLSEMDETTQKIVYLLINVFSFDPEQDKLSDFLLIHLNIIENVFAKYLLKEVKGNTDYENKAQLVLSKLSGNTPYNLLDFNYTEPKSQTLEVSRNIHSTLENNPIFGIDSAEVNANANYYQFTKTYRIMRLAVDNSNTQLLPKSVNKIIFYGHSLSQADYSYFQSIFDYYNIYSENITLIFYYSKYGNYDIKEIAKDQFDKVSRLLENYGKSIPDKGKSLLPKLLLEKRVKILEYK